jgi:hypothetical protein
MLIINDQCPVVIVFRELPGGLFGGDVATFRNEGDGDALDAGLSAP